GEPLELGPQPAALDGSADPDGDHEQRLTDVAERADAGPELAAYDVTGAAVQDLTDEAAHVGLVGGGPGVVPEGRADAEDHRAGEHERNATDGDADAGEQGEEQGDDGHHREQPAEVVAEHRQYVDDHHGDAEPGGGA